MKAVSSRSENSNKLIIVLDDDSASRDSLVFLLTIEGFDVRSYASPTELLNDPAPSAFHCLVADFHMPGMSGLDLVEKLRESKSCPRAILVTSHATAAIRERAGKLRVPIILKPFHGTELVKAIRTA